MTDAREKNPDLNTEKKIIQKIKALKQNKRYRSSRLRPDTFVMLSLFRSY